MASFTNHDGDDDDFDWEAAVKAIDIACEKTVGASTSKTHQIGRGPNPGGGQSTLDKFFSNPITSKHVTPPKEVVVEEELGFDEGVSNCVKIDPEAALTWIYPVNIPLRDYQLAITRTALFSNTLVALPTGLGKTLIAAVVMYNYFRWFPEGGEMFTSMHDVSMSGKIVFAAPSRPLVMQQIEACHNIVGIPQEWTIDMTGQTSPVTRACYWKAKRVFFVTPQVLEKDIQSGSCLVKHLVCLVVDEAHRASGNYSYCVAVRELMDAPVQLRILALTATPGSKQQTIQQIIDNLQISVLEYRSESDHDVTPYVHNRKIELIEVPMGQDALQVNNLLLEIIRPFVARLSGIGVLRKRDFRTLSPCDLLNSRDKFRQAPPKDLHHFKYGEVEGYFGVLITLYHIRKLLSSHGIRPAFEMLEEKLKQGSFSRFMSRNEVLSKAKLLMRQTLSHGDLSPKFSKMLEVLVEHFKTKDSRSSRVIIFSNFRGSVRDIMNALSNIGEYVKATEFIGQSSGKTSKGQSQKVQQAVLQKFRAGGYNVIVATSIGEEGLDIMEVDLVICFDANVSPLRMIQRMGRTGRKHEGRVVVLACEGSELKGYMRKQANGKAIKTHMRNGGMNSFHFHSSPRMVPHVFRPKVRFIKLSIEQFVPHGKKVKDDDTIHTVVFNSKLTETEIDLVAKYFHPSGYDKWRPSLIAFPHFQAYPSRVHEVVHSVRTGILIGTMQHLQGLSFSRDNKDFNFKDEAASDRCVRVGIEQSGFSSEAASVHEVPVGDVIRQESESNDLFQMENTRNKDHCTPDSGSQSPIHSFLFGSDFVSVDLLGRILVVSVPVLPPCKVYHTKCSSPSRTLFLNCFKEDSAHLKNSLGQNQGISMTAKAVPSFKTRILGSKALRPTSLRCSNGLQEKTQAGTERNFQTQIEDGNTKDTAGKSTTMLLLADASSADLKDVDLSPRLTNFIECGVVPESPIDNGILRSEEKGEFMVVDQDPPSKLHSELHQLPIPIINDEGRKDRTPTRGDIASSCMKDEIQTLVIDLGNSSCGRLISDSKVVVGIQTPSLSSTNCSKEWALSSGGKSESMEQEHKFKRLFKYVDSNRRPFHANEEKFCTTETKAKSYGRTNLCTYKLHGGKNNLVNDVKSFIEEEAEVSSQVAVSADEEYEQEFNSYDDIFIDDRINVTVTSTQAEATPTDMMAIYRRSLLSQSPREEKLNSSMEIRSNSVVSKSMIHVSGSSAGTSNLSPEKLQTGFDYTAGNPSTKFSSQIISSEGMPVTPNGFSKENSSAIESRKRKLSFIPHGFLPIYNLEQDFLFNSEDATKGSFLQDQDSKTEVGRFVFDDDQFYEGIDFDALEKQAAKLLRSKPESSVHNQSVIPEPIPDNRNIPGSPSFDLGI